MARYKTYNVGCTNCHGDRPVDDFLNKDIAAVAKKYKISEKDFDIIAKAFRDACERGYLNGLSDGYIEMAED